MSGLIDLKSQVGQSLLDDCQSGQSGSVYQPYIHAVFNKQIGPFNCGIQSSAIIQSAYQLGKASPLSSANVLAKITQPITEENMVNYEATTKVVSLEEINRTGGCTLDQLTSILEGHGREVLKVFASDCDVNQFRENARSGLSSVDSETGVIINYHMGKLGQGRPYGHHSPLAAYHADTDRFLLMDTGSETEECWAKAEDIYKAMCGIDKTANKTRGFCIVK